MRAMLGKPDRGHTLGKAVEQVKHGARQEHGEGWPRRGNGLPATPSGSKMERAIAVRVAQGRPVWRKSPFRSKRSDQILPNFAAQSYVQRTLASTEFLERQPEQM